MNLDRRITMTLPSSMPFEDTLLQHQSSSFMNRPAVAWAVVYPSDGSPPVKLWDRTLIGRDPCKCHIVVDDPRISSVHCALDLRRNVPVVQDLSSNGSFLNGRRLPRDRLVKIVAGDVVQLVATSGNSWVKQLHFHPLANVVPEAFAPKHTGLAPRGHSHHGHVRDPQQQHLLQQQGGSNNDRARALMMMQYPGGGGVAAPGAAPMHVAPRWEEPKERVIIGRGATSQVFLAIDSETGEFLAVKEIVKPPSMRSHQKPKHGAAAARLQHRSVTDAAAVARTNSDAVAGMGGQNASSTSNLTARPETAEFIGIGGDADRNDDDDENEAAAGPKSRGPGTSKLARATVRGDGATDYAHTGEEEDRQSPTTNDNNHNNTGGYKHKMPSDGGWSDTSSYRSSDSDDDDDDDDGSGYEESGDDDDDGIPPPGMNRQNASGTLCGEGVGVAAAPAEATMRSEQQQQQQQQHSHHRHKIPQQQRTSKGLSELYLLQQLHHERIVRFRGAEETEDVFRLFFEYISGGSMKDLLQKFGELSDNVVRLYTLHVLHGMLYLHSQGVIHGDLKPANILVTDAGVVKITDFGTSIFEQQQQNAAAASSSSNDSSLHSHPAANGGGLIGSPCYMSPEMCRGTRASFASDVWALGCTVLEMATGIPPWSECNFTESVAAVYNIGRANHGPSMTRLLNRSQALFDFVQACFAASPIERPSIQALLMHPFIVGESPPPQWNNGNSNAGVGGGDSNNSNTNFAAPAAVSSSSFGQQRQPQQQQQVFQPMQRNNSSGMMGPGQRALSFLDEFGGVGEDQQQQQQSYGFSNSNQNYHNSNVNSNSNSASAAAATASRIASRSAAVMQEIEAHRSFLRAKTPGGSNSMVRVHSNGSGATPTPGVGAATSNSVNNNNGGNNTEGGGALRRQRAAGEEQQMMVFPSRPIQRNGFGDGGGSALGLTGQFENLALARSQSMIGSQQQQPQRHHQRQPSPHDHRMRRY